MLNYLNLLGIDEIGKKRGDRFVFKVHRLYDAMHSNQCLLGNPVGLQDQKLELAHSRNVTLIRALFIENAFVRILACKSCETDGSSVTTIIYSETQVKKSLSSRLFSTEEKGCRRQTSRRDAAPLHRIARKHIGFATCNFTREMIEV